MPRPQFILGKDSVSILQEARWIPGLVWTSGKSCPHQDSIPYRPARCQSLYRLSYPAQGFTCLAEYFIFTKARHFNLITNLLTGITTTKISVPFISRKLVMARTGGQLRNLSSLKSFLHTQWRTVSGILMVFQLISLRKVEAVGEWNLLFGNCLCY